jgi:hypothetical protein
MICKNCGGKFSAKIRLEGKEVWLKGRSYCLECSPYGKREYKSAKRIAENVGSTKECPICSKVFKWTKNDVCTGCRSWHQRYKKKLRAIALLGGKCKCGQADPDVLTFHHKYDKDFTLANNWNILSWEKIETELKKCELLCFHCHIKHHKKENHERFLKITAYYENGTVDQRQSQQT